MRHWLPASTSGSGIAPTPNLTGSALGAMVHQLGDDGFACGMLQELAPVLPAASWWVYRTGRHCKPTLFMSASYGIPDTTQDCWTAGVPTSRAPTALTAPGAARWTKLPRPKHPPSCAT